MHSQLNFRARASAYDCSIIVAVAIIFVPYLAGKCCVS